MNKEQERVFRKIYDTYAQKLLSYIRMQLNAHSLEDAEDILQEVFCALAKHFETMSNVPEYALHAWLYKVARHKVINSSKKKFRKQEILTEQAELDRLFFADIDPGFDEIVDVMTILPYVEQLTPMEQQLILQRIREVKFKDIAADTQKDRRFLQNKYYYAVKKLKKILKKAGWPYRML